MIQNLRGRAAFIFDAPNFDVDRIIGIQNMHVTDPEKLRTLMMQEFDATFVSKVTPGDLIIGGVNFGYGHPHYPAMQMMRNLGITGVIAESFAPVFWNVEVASGFPQFSCPSILKNVARWDDIEVVVEEACVVNHTQNKRAPISPMSKHDLAVLNAGGVIAYLKRELGIEAAAVK